MNKEYPKRVLDFVMALAVMVVLSPLMLVLYFLVVATSRGGGIHWSERVGRHGKAFLMPKFRTMKTGTPQVATHLIEDPEKYLSPIGGFMRRTSLDELPQLLSIVRGDMSLVGPRPALYNQDDLIELRKEKGIDVLRPGLTGLAQINGRDEIPNDEKVMFDERYLQERAFSLDMKILWRSFIKVFYMQDVSH